MNNSYFKKADLATAIANLYHRLVEVKYRDSHQYLAELYWLILFRNQFQHKMFILISSAIQTYDLIYKISI